MSSYIHFTEEQKQRAAAVDLEEFLRCRGEKLITSGREKRLASDHSVTVRGNEWYDHAEERGGHAVSFVQKFYGLSYPDAVTMLLGGEMGTVYPPAGERVEEPPKPFVLPPANKDMRRVYAYLVKHRGIDRSVIAHFAREKLLYEDADYHNAVFVGTDEVGVPRHAHKRSANSYGKAFRLNVEGSDPRHSFHHIGKDGSLYVFEAPIDMLSYITLHPENWQEHSYVACCGTSIQPVLKMLERVPQLDTVLLCLDNDEAGHLASQRMSAQLTEHYAVERLIPENKDWNDDLTASNALVYTDADGNLIRLTRDDFASEEEFLCWKKVSDADYHGEEKADHLYYDGTLSLEGLSEEAIAVPSAEEGYIAEIDLSERQLLGKLLLQGMGDKLTELQRIRLWLYCVDGLSEQAIAEKHGVDQQRVSKSIVAAKKKLKKFLKKRG